MEVCPWDTGKKIILQTNFTKFTKGEIPYKHVLHDDRGTICYNSVNLNGVGFNTKTFIDNFEKALQYLLKIVANDRKLYPECEDLKILMP